MLMPVWLRHDLAGKLTHNNFFALTFPQIFVILGIRWHEEKMNKIAPKMKCLSQTITLYAHRALVYLQLRLMAYTHKQQKKVCR